jgi:hypothetical protein
VKQMSGKELYERWHMFFGTPPLSDGDWPWSKLPTRWRDTWDKLAEDLSLREIYLDELKEILESILGCDLCDGCATIARELLENDPRAVAGDMLRCVCGHTRLEHVKTRDHRIDCPTCPGWRLR